MNTKTRRNMSLKLNTLSSLGYQVINIVCNFILPRLILNAYGSEVNGLVNSITQFLHIIGFLELGVGSVVQSALYKPLAEKDFDSVSKVIASAQKFFKRLACILVGYVSVLVFIYPYISDQNFSWGYTAVLIVAISISSFAQYYFGIVNALLLNADQHGYIQYFTQIGTIILNTIACVLLIRAGAGIHIVKLTTSLIFLLRPMVFVFYVNKHYKINRRIKYDVEPIKQKWNGIAQHIAAVILDGTDIVVLTSFSTLANVSIYSVYHIVLNGVKNVFLSLTQGVKALIGELWAKQELKALNQTFGWFEWILHNGTIFVFGCTGVLIVPFVSVYTEGVTDANYIQPLFAVLLTLAHAGHCLRLPYSVMILAGGHYKQTQHNYIVVAIMNIVISVAMVISFGLMGVAIGTLVAMMYQTVWMAHYVSKNLIRWPFKNFLKQVVVDTITVMIASGITYWIKLANINYFSWIIMGLKVAAIWFAVILVVNLIFYRERVLIMFNKLLKREKDGKNII